MKKTLFALTFLAFASTGVFAQKTLKATPTQQDKKVEATTPATTANLEFVKETHDFGNLQEGDAAEAEFVFKNTGKEPIIIQNVRPSCGCTAPSWSKEAVAPGKTGVIKAAYGTKGRVGSFNKSISVISNAGTHTIWIKGNVEKAPETSVPQNNSMMKVNN